MIVKKNAFRVQMDFNIELPTENPGTSQHSPLDRLTHVQGKKGKKN
jgi:hypothetical protein